MHILIGNLVFNPTKNKDTKTMGAAPDAVPLWILTPMAVFQPVSIVVNESGVGFEDTQLPDAAGLQPV